jgi:hypothetical protein
MMIRLPPPPRAALAWLLSTIMGLWLSAASAAVPMLGPPAAAPVPGVVTLEVFVRDGCPYCARAEAFFDRLSPERSDLRVVYRNVDHDLLAMPDLVQRSRAAGVWPPGVPSFAIGPRVLAGFADERTSAQGLLAFIDKAAVPPDSLRIPGLGTLPVARIGMPLFSLLTGMRDGVALCSLVFLSFPLVVLMAQRHRGRRWALGLSFFVAIAACQYLLDAGWVDLTLAVSASRPVRWGLGLIAVAMGLLLLLQQRGLLPAALRPRHAEDGPDRLLGLGAGLATAVPAGLGIAVATSLAGLLCTAGDTAVLNAAWNGHGLAGVSRHLHAGLHALGQAGIAVTLLSLALLMSGQGTPGIGRRRAIPLALMLLAVGGVLLTRAAWLR